MSSSSNLQPLSACVTRILSLSGFAPELKTRDFQQAFSEWENVMGGFKIKWVNDTSLYIVFHDPTVAKRAYLQALFSPPPILKSPHTSKPAKIRPYDGPDAQSVIQAVNSRGGGGGGGHVRGHSSRASIAVGGGINGAHARMGSGIPNPPPPVPRSSLYQGDNITIPPPSSAIANREPSPTLPNLPTQPALSSLISSSLSSDHIAEEVSPDGLGSAAPPKIGDPGKRMVAHVLGVRHPGLNRSHSGSELNTKVRELQRSLHGVSLTE